MRDRQEAIDRGQHLGIGDEFEQVVPDVVVNAEAHLLDRDIGGVGRDLEAGGERQRPQRAMRRHRHVIGLGHRRDPAAFADAAGVAEIGLDDVHRAALEERLEVPA